MVGVCLQALANDDLVIHGLPFEIVISGRPLLATLTGVVDHRRMLSLLLPRRGLIWLTATAVCFSRWMTRSAGSVLPSRGAIRTYAVARTVRFHVECRDARQISSPLYPQMVGTLRSPDGVCSTLYPAEGCAAHTCMPHLCNSDDILQVCGFSNFHSYRQLGNIFRKSKNRERIANVGCTSSVRIDIMHRFKYLQQPGRMLCRKHAVLSKA